jgi:RNA polymerase sigma-70 factor (ECF subfamily)
MYAYIYRRVGDAALAEDMTGELFVRVLRAVRSRRPWRTSFRAWLYRIAHNLVVDHYRRQPPLAQVSLEEALSVVGEENPADDVETNRLRTELLSAVKQLTPIQQEVLALRFGEGLTAKETGQTMRKTTGAIEALQHRALAALKRILAREEM